MKNENNIAIDLNGYRVIYMPDHHRAMTNETWNGFVYEHIVIAEGLLGRTLEEDEVVHHLDGNRANNRAANLLVLLRSQHAKLHMWLRSGAPTSEIVKDGDCKSFKTAFGPPMFCKCCGRTLQLKNKYYCSDSCAKLDRRKVERPSKKQLEDDLNSMSFVSIGRKYGVSDNAVRKWAKSYSLNK